jgi:integrase
MNGTSEQVAGRDSCLRFSEFVERVFIPEYVLARRSAGRAHYYAMLKHVMTPEAVHRLFRPDADESKLKLRSIPGWPYIDGIRLCAVSEDNVQQIVTKALEQGYSPQTVIHIRNVVNAIFAHAAAAGAYSGRNPASNVALPEMSRKEAHILTLHELQQAFEIMHYPEREAALLAMTTNMTICEICGLQWKQVNLSDVRRMVDAEWIASKSIAVRRQNYRCEVGPVTDARKRVIPIPDALVPVLSNLKDYKRFNRPEDFVFAARNGSPMSQCNIAARRLKVVGTKLGLAHLNWQSFRRTYAELNTRFGREFQTELNRAFTWRGR